MYYITFILEYVLWPAWELSRPLYCNSDFTCTFTASASCHGRHRRWIKSRETYSDSGQGQGKMKLDRPEEVVVSWGGRWGVMMNCLKSTQAGWTRHAWPPNKNLQDSVYSSGWWDDGVSDWWRQIRERGLDWWFKRETFHFCNKAVKTLKSH